MFKKNKIKIDYIVPIFLIRKKKIKTLQQEYTNEGTGHCSPSGTRFTMKPLARGFEPPHPHKQLPNKKNILMRVVFVIYINSMAVS